MVSDFNLELSHNKEDNIVFIIGETSKLLENKRTRLFFKEYLHYELLSDGIKVPVIDNINNTISLIKKAISYTSFNLSYSENISEELNDFLTNEKEFILYSNNALAIRNNNCNVEDFKNFKNFVQEKLIGRVLYPLQFLSAYHLAFSQNACNFSVPGAGKTSIVYGAFAYLNSLPKNHYKYVDTILIIGPLSSFGPWENEYFECFNRKAKGLRLSGGMKLEDKKLALYSSSKPEIILLSYASVISLKDELNYFLSRNNCMVVLDEAHKIKNINDGVIAQSVLELSTICKSRVILTGTPAPNGYEDLYNLFQFIWPGKRIIKFSKGQLRDMTLNQNDSRVPDLIDSISPFFIRIRKSDLQIPDYDELNPILVRMSENQRKVYDIVESRFVSEIVNTKEKAIYSALARARMIRLMQLASNPQLLSEPVSEIDDFVSSTSFPDDSLFLADLKQICIDETPPKFIEARNIVADIINDGEKVIIWCCFTKTINSLSQYFFQNGIKNKILYGATPIEKGNGCENDIEEESREKIIRDFHKSDSEFKVIIANSYAVAESISLHKACHNAIYLERTFNASNYIQSKDRIHRYGLEPGVKTKYYFILSENSIEETIHRRLKEKEKRLLEVIESMPIPLFNLIDDDSSSDIAEILKDYARRSKTI
jgi:SNF2 family DNA or RNA helicase